ncbi:PqqD family protein [Bacillus sp. CGMCC 1.16607]|uniref:PqqD family protein n=1 Tax=Bacillus sp. CGMCC 1.16607 TaxID=3351842 RepID=UPI003644F71E
MNITFQSKIKMHRLKSRIEDDDEVVIGRVDTGEYILLPKIGIEIIDLLDEGKSIGEVKHIIEERYCEEVDVLDFAKDLIMDYKFAYMLDGIIVNEQDKTKDHLAWIPGKVGDYLFGKMGYMIYIVIILSCLFPLVLSEGMVYPHYSDIFITSYSSINILLTVSISWFFLGIHEIAHLISAKSLGIGSRIRLSHRLFFMVAETNMSNIVLVEPKKRYRAFLAGMALDGMFLSIVFWIQYLHEIGLFSLLPTTLSIFKLLGYIFFMGLSFQFMFFMQTDIYYTITTFLRCNNLIVNTRLFLMMKVKKKLTLHQQSEWEGVSLKEKKVIKWYSWVYVLGISWAIIFFLSYTFPQLIEFYSNSFRSVFKFPFQLWFFIDGIFYLTITSIPFVVVIWSWMRTLKRNKIRSRSNAL